jgi:hypothetical protein
VESHGESKWSLVATLLGGRIGKQARAIRRSPAASRHDPENNTCTGHMSCHPPVAR